MTLATAHQNIPVGQTFQVLPLRRQGAVGQLRQKVPGDLERVWCSWVSLGVSNPVGSLHLGASRVMAGPCPRRGPRTSPAMLPLGIVNELLEE